MIESMDQKIDQIKERYQKLKTYLFAIEKNNESEKQIQTTVYEIISEALKLNDALEERYQKELQEINERTSSSIYESTQKMDEIIALNNRRQEELESIPELGVTASDNIERLSAIKSNLLERRTLITANEIIAEQKESIQNQTDDFALFSDELEDTLDDEVIRMYDDFGLNALTSTEIHEEVNIQRINMRISDSNYLIKTSSSSAFSPEERKAIRELSYEELDSRMSFYEAREKQILLYIKELSEMPVESMDFLREKRLIMLEYLNERKQMRIDLGLQAQEDKLASLEEMITSQLVKFNTFKDRQNLIRIYDNQIEKNQNQIKKIETVLEGLGIHELYDKVLENNKEFKPSEKGTVEVINISPVVDKVIKLYHEESDNSIHIGLFENGELVTALPGNYQGKDRKSIIESLKQYQSSQQYNDYSFDFRFPKEYQENIILDKDSYQVSYDEDKKDVIELGPGKEMMVSPEKNIAKVPVKAPLRAVVDRDGPIFTDEERFKKGYDYLTKENAKNLGKLKDLDKQEEEKKNTNILERVPVVSIRTIPEKVKNFFRQNKRKIASGLVAMATALGVMTNVVHAPVTSVKAKLPEEEPSPTPAIEQSVDEAKIEDEYEEALEDLDNIDFNIQSTPKKTAPTPTPKPASTQAPTTAPIEKEETKVPVSTPSVSEDIPEIIVPIEKPEQAPEEQAPIITPDVEEEIVLPTPTPVPEVPVGPETTAEVETPFVDTQVPNILVQAGNGDYIKVSTEEHLNDMANKEEIEAPRRR